MAEGQMARTGAGTPVFVYPVRDTAASLAAMLTALPLGVFAAVMFYVLAASVFAPGDEPGWLFAVVFPLGWMASTGTMAYNARRVVTVVERAFVIAAIQWMLVVLLGSDAVVQAWTRVMPDTASERTSYMVGQYVAPLMRGIAPIQMALLALLGFFVCAFFARRMLDRD